MSDRYHIVSRMDEAGQPAVALVLGRPSPLAPDDPKQDRKDGPTLIAGENVQGGQFWADVLAADIVWTGSFKRYWEYNPRVAARIRIGADL